MATTSILAACSDGDSRYEDTGSASAPICVTCSPAIVGLAVNDTPQEADNGCFLTSRGAVYCWQGYSIWSAVKMAAPNIFPGNASTPFTPVQVSLPGEAVSLAVGDDTGCAVLSDSTVWCWGGGDGSKLLTRPSGAALQIADSTGPISATSISGTDANYCVVTTAGGVLCWNDSYDGVPGTYLDTITPTVPSGLGAGAGISSVSVATNSACALESSPDIGTPRLLCWGDNSTGQLGNFSTTSSSTPVVVWNGALTSATNVSAGMDDTCAIKVNGAAYCWGTDMLGEVGNDTPDPLQEQIIFSWPQAVYNSAGPVSQVSVGEAGACEVQGGKLLCWGALAPQSNLLPTGIAIAPKAFPVGSDVVTRVAAGLSICWATSDAHVRCSDMNSVTHTVW